MLPELATLFAAATPTPTPPETIDFSWAAARQRVGSWSEGASRLLPNVIVALVLLVIFYGLATFHPESWRPAR